MQRSGAVRTRAASLVSYPGGSRRDQLVFGSATTTTGGPKRLFDGSGWFENGRRTCEKVYLDSARTVNLFAVLEYDIFFRDESGRLLVKESMLGIKGEAIKTSNNPVLILEGLPAGAQAATLNSQVFDSAAGLLYEVSRMGEDWAFVFLRPTSALDRV